MGRGLRGWAQNSRGVALKSMDYLFKVLHYLFSDFTAGVGDIEGCRFPVRCREHGMGGKG